MSQAPSMPVVVPKAAESGPMREVKKRVPAAVTFANFVAIRMGKITIMVTIMATIITIMVTIMVTITGINIKIIKRKKGAKRLYPIS